METRELPGDNPPSELDAYHELQCYTFAHSDPAYIHQHVVGAWIAQHADEGTKPIGLAFALIGLYLYVERGFSGREVQRVHMKLARHKQSWPAFSLPQDRGSITASTIMAKPAGPERDEAINDWCRSVWAAFRGNREVIVELLGQYGILGT